MLLRIRLAIKVLLLAWVTLSLLACSSMVSEQKPAPVVAVRMFQSVKRGVHTVQPGESLYTIALRYNRDIKEIAITNQIYPPYKIHPGDRINLRPPTQLQVRTFEQHMHARLQKREHQKKQAAKAKPSQKKVTTSSKTAKGGAKQEYASHPKEWMMPAKGTIKGFFSLDANKPNKGIDIFAAKGTTITATAPGKVVYSGNGLRGYGNLLIIKHNEDFLSAYAHNQKLLVKEDQYVKSGQPIATMGNTGTDEVKLHFEIRLHGTPVDPMKYLRKQS